MVRNKNVLIAVDESFKYWLKEMAVKEKTSMLELSKRIAHDRSDMNFQFKLNFAPIIPKQDGKRKTFW